VVTNIINFYIISIVWVVKISIIFTTKCNYCGHYSEVAEYIGQS